MLGGETRQEADLWRFPPPERHPENCEARWRYSETEMETRTPRKRERDPEAEAPQEELLYGGGPRRA